MVACCLLLFELQSEIIKYYTALGRVAPLYFWRDYLGTEIDALLEVKGKELTQF